MGFGMKDYITDYLEYLKVVKHSSDNTILSYKRDLLKLYEYLSENKLDDLNAVTITELNNYTAFLKKNNMSTATISRNVASIKSFFLYLFKNRVLEHDPAELLKPPRIEKKLPDILTIEEVKLLLEQPSGDMPKQVRDKAMLELLYATGIRVTELVNLRASDVNLKYGYLVCADAEKERVIPIESAARDALERYLKDYRGAICGESEYLFTNLKGGRLSRQGFWKLMKNYAVLAGIDKDITPHMIRHTFASHLVTNGADLKAVQEMLGHADISTTQIYVKNRTGTIKDEYDKAHPRA